MVDREKEIGARNVLLSSDSEKLGLVRVNLTENLKEILAMANKPDVSLSVTLLLSRLIDSSLVDGGNLTGSLARFAAGFGSFETYLKAAPGITELYELFGNDNQKITGVFGKAIRGLYASDLDMDICLNHKSGLGNIDTYKEVIQAFSDKKVGEERVWKKEIKGTYYEYRESFFVFEGGENRIKMSVMVGSVESNPKLKNIVARFEYSKDGVSFEPVIHVDVSSFPTDGAESMRQKRHGGNTIRSQDVCRPRITLDNGNLFCEVGDLERMAFKGVDTITITDKDAIGVAELSFRALRMRLIHAPSEKGEFNISSLSKFIDASNLFSIRRSVQESAIKGVLPNPSDLYLAVKDFVLCFNYDPYTALQFLQDSNLYVLFPLLKSLRANQWKDLFLDRNLQFTKTAGSFTDRSLTQIRTDRFEYLRQGKKDGFERFLKALSNVAFRGEDHNLSKTLNSLGSENVKEKVEFMDRKGTQGRIKKILETFGGGLTEREINRIYNVLVKTKDERLNEDVFRKEFRGLKIESRIDKQVRTVKERGKDKNVIMYSLRPKSRIDHVYIGKIKVVVRSCFDGVSQHPYLNRANQFLTEKNVEISSNEICHNLKVLEDYGVGSIEALRSLSQKDFKDIFGDEYDFNKSKLLQIISEDVLKCPSS